MTWTLGLGSVWIRSPNVGTESLIAMSIGAAIPIFVIAVGLGYLISGASKRMGIPIGTNARMGIIGLLAVGMGSCTIAGTSYNQRHPTEPSQAESTQFRPRLCEYAVTFPGRPKEGTAETTVLGNVKQGYGATQMVSGVGFFRAECYALGAGELSALTEANIRDAGRVLIETIGISDYNLSYQADQLGKACHVRGVKVVDEPKGGAKVKLNVQGKVVVGSKSLLFAAIFAPAPLPTEAALFLSSIQRPAK